MKTAYTLKKRKGTKEMHLFEGDFNEEPCTSKAESICHKMKKSESIGNVFQCLDEQEAREECAEIGRPVCGDCVSRLYATN